MQISGGAGDSLREWLRLEVRRKHDGVDERLIVTGLPLRTQKERELFAERAIDVALHIGGVIGRLRGGERVARIEGRVVALHEVVAMQFVGAGFGEDLDAAPAKGIVLRGVWILVDAYLSNGGFGRQLAAAEAVDEELRAALRIGAGDGLKLLLQVLGIVGQRIEVPALHDDGAAVSIRAGVERVAGDIDLLLLHIDLQ